MNTGGESAESRRRRHRRRLYFDSVAEDYEASRLGYPPEAVDFIATTAGLEPGSRVLEVGCGTGQLTEGLVSRGFEVTAIDIGPAMLAAARRRVGASAAEFRLSSYEAFEPLSGPGSFDLIVSATAFHWIDPEVKFVKSASLLGPEGWLALLSTGEHYDEALVDALRALWAARSGDGVPPVSRPWASDLAIDPDGELFGPVVEKVVEERTARTPVQVGRVESTRGTRADWTPEDRESFDRELRALVEGNESIPLTQHTEVRMAPVRSPSARTRPGAPDQASSGRPDPLPQSQEEMMASVRVAASSRPPTARQGPAVGHDTPSSSGAAPGGMG